MFEYKPMGRTARFIEDIKPGKAAAHVNVRDEQVRRQSIGYLDSRYLELTHIVGGGRSMDTVTTAGQTGALRYTRIPPLTTKKHAASPILFENSFTSFKSLLNSIGAGVVATAVAFRHALGRLPWLPKKYSMYKGVYTDFGSATFTRTRWTVLILLVSSGLLLASLPWSGPVTQPTHNPAINPRLKVVVPVQTTKTNNRSAPTKSSGGTPNTVNSQASTRATYRPATPTSIMNSGATGAAPYVPALASGGMGGGTPIIDVTPTSSSPTPSTTGTAPTPTAPVSQSSGPVGQILNDPLAPVAPVTNLVNTIL